MSAQGIIELGANRPAARPYRGGSGIARFRGIAHDDPWRPEDFLGSTTEVFAGGGVGLTRLGDGRTLREAVARDPEGYLGPAHPQDAGTGLLTKLLSTDERLFIHAHPDDAFAREHGFGACGKTESWLVLDVAGSEDPYVLLGFRRDVAAQELSEWFERQDVAAMTGAMHRVAVSPGDTFHVPAGLAHGIGPGITLVELQQPSDLSILLEYAGYPGLDRAGALLALPRDVALGAFRLQRVGDGELDRLRGSRNPRGRVQRLFPEEADRYYEALRIRPGERAARLEAGFSILVVLGGRGAISWSGASREVRAGETLLVRYDAGPITIDPGLDLVSCGPPREGESR